MTRALRVGINCARLAHPAPLHRAAALGCAEYLDLPAPAARCWAPVATFLDAAPRTRVVAKVGYCAVDGAPDAARDVGGGVAHALADAAWVAREAERCAELLKRPADAILLHGAGPARTVGRLGRTGRVAAAHSVEGGRGAAAATTWTYDGDGPRRRRGDDVAL